MSRAAKSSKDGRGPAAARSGSDDLRFLKRTMQFHSSDAAKEVIFQKLHSLKKALDRQETALSSGPVSPAKARIREALAKAKTELAATLATLGNPPSSPTGDDEPRIARHARRAT